MRTLNVGHLFTQGTVDSNEVWVELIVKQGDQVIGHSGGIGPDGTVDPYAHFINVYMLDRHGNRIDRRNAARYLRPALQQADPPRRRPGRPLRASKSPTGITGPLTLEARVNYRKFDRKYMDYVFGPGPGARAARHRAGERLAQTSRRRRSRRRESPFSHQGSLAALE